MQDVCEWRKIRLFTRCISNYKLCCCIVHAKPAKLAKVVTYGLCELRGLGVNLKNIIIITYKRMTP